MTLSISIKKNVNDEEEAKKVADKISAALADEKDISISAVVFTEIVKPVPLPLK